MNENSDLETRYITAIEGLKKSEFMPDFLEGLEANLSDCFAADPYVTAYNCGKLAAVKELIEMLRDI